MCTPQGDGYALKTPCRHCPFRSDITPYLTHERAKELANNLADSGDFPCHKTVDYDQDSAGQRTERTQQCAGALILQEKSNTVGQLTRIAERLGMYDASALNMAAPVYSSVHSFVAAHAPEQETAAEYCGVAADSSCENPQAYSGRSGFSYNTQAPSCDMWCSSCGEAMCGSCSSGQDELCRHCADDEETGDE